MVDRIPTMKTSNCRMCLLLATGQMGMLMIEDAERLQARPPATCPMAQNPQLLAPEHSSSFRSCLPKLINASWLCLQACDVRQKRRNR